MRDRRAFEHRGCNKRSSAVASGVLVSALLAGCASGPLGARPEATAPRAPDPASKVVTVTFELRDQDRTPCWVRIDYSSDNGATWHDATILSASAGVVTGKGSITGLRPPEAYSQMTVLWDSWTDNVGKSPGGDDNVLVRITPSDGDGVGAPAVSAAPFKVDNYIAALRLGTSSLTFNHGLGNAAPPDDQAIDMQNTGPGGTTLNWTASIPVGAQGWLSGTPLTGTEADDLTLSVNVAGLDVGTRTTIVTISDPAAYDSPKTITVTLRVSRPVMRLQLASVAFDEVPWNLAPSPGDKTFTIYNDGPAYTELCWEIDDTVVGWPDWLTVSDPPAKSGMVTGGGSRTVTLSADHLGPPLQPVNPPDSPYTLTVDETAGAGVPSRSVAVTLPVRHQRPEIFIHDGGGDEFTGGIMLVTCVEGAATSDSFSIRNDGEPAALLDWTLSEGADWLTCAPALGGSLAVMVSDSVTVDVTSATLTPDPLSPWDYEAVITVSGGDLSTGAPAEGGAKTLAVHFNVLLRGQLDLLPADVSFTDATQTVSYPVGEWVDVDLTNSGEVDLNWSGAWVGAHTWVDVTAGVEFGTVSPGGSDSDTLRFTVNASAIALPLGDNTATYRYVNTGTLETRDLVLSLEVMTQASLVTSPALTMDFVMVTSLPVTSIQYLYISNIGEAPLGWVVSENSTGWLSLTNVDTPPCPGGQTHTVQVTVDRSVGPLTVAGSPYTADITVSAADALGSPQTITVNVSVVTEIQIGTGTYAWSYPMHTGYEDSRTQVIYLAGEIGGPITINALSLYVTQRPEDTSTTYMLNNWTIRMKHTLLSSYGTSSWEGPASGWTTVYQADVNAAAWSVPGWITFNFTTSFPYNGASNLMVDFSHNNSAWWNSGACHASTPGGTRSIYHCTDSGYGNNPLNWSGTSNPIPVSSAYVPNIKLNPAP